MENQTLSDNLGDIKSSTNPNPKRIAVIGGGLAGMSAAFRLRELSHERREPLEVCLIEAGDRLGGIVGTNRIGEYLVDIGADSFLTNKPGAVNLCRRLKIDDRLMATDSTYRGALVLSKGRPMPVPDGFQLLSPTAIWPMLTTPVLSWSGKCRMLMELFVRCRSSDSTTPADVDESVAAFARRRFGKEALERLIQPLVGGIYTSDPERLSLAATMPRFQEMERQYGSLIRASMSTRSAKHKANGSNDMDTSSGARYGLFAGLRGGMQDLVDALAVSVQSNCRIKLNCPVQSILQSRAPSESNAEAPAANRFRLTFSDGQHEDFDAVIVTTATYRASQILSELDRELSDELNAVEYASSALVITGHRLSDVTNPLNAFGLVIPHIEKRKILAVSFSSRKFPDRAPAGHVLLRTFVGGALQPELYNLSDEEMIRTVKSELSQILGVHGEPDFIRVYRYPKSMPQYHVGHLDRISRIEERTRRYPGLALAGIGYRGVGIPDVIANAERAAEALL